MSEDFIGETWIESSFYANLWVLFVPEITNFVLLVSQNLKQFVNSFQKIILLFNLFALIITINNKWNLYKLNKIRIVKNWIKGSNFINRMVACKWQDSMEDYKVWEHGNIFWKRYIELQLPPFSLETLNSWAETLVEEWQDPSGFLLHWSSFVWCSYLPEKSLTFA